VQPKITDAERIKKTVRKMAAGRVLAGDRTDVCLDLAHMKGCQVRIAAGYGSLSDSPQAQPRDRMIWMLDGFAQVYDTAGQITHVSQGESIVLAGGQAYRLVFPQLSLYLLVEPRS
jgi:hypothetical protein